MLFEQPFFVTTS